MSAATLLGPNLVRIVHVMISTDFKSEVKFAPGVLQETDVDFGKMTI